MAEHRCQFFGPYSFPTVWSVEDAWFEGEGGKDSVDAEIYLEGITTLEVLRKKIVNKVARFDYLFLDYLVKLCIQHRCRLALCNFEYFQSHFAETNNPGQAVLLDVNYDKAVEWPPQGYGVHLLADKLKGRRFRGDIFFVTGYPPTVRQIIFEAHKDDPHWWSLRCVPCVMKDKNVESELLSFFNYFIEGTAQNPIEIFSRALLESQAFSHPNRHEDILPDFLLKGVFEDTDSGREYFKALYHYPSPPSLLRNSGRGERIFSTIVFKEHLSYAGIEAEVEEESEFLLPVQPGMLFVLCLLRFLQALEVNHFKLTFASDKSNPSGRRATVTIPLRHPDIFKAAVLTGGGDAVAALRSLLACNKSVFVESTRDADERKKREEAAARWQEPKPYTSRIFMPLLDYEIRDGKLLLSWTFVL